MSSLLADLIAPLAPDDFLAQYVGRRPLYVPGPPTRHADWFGWEALDDVLSRTPLPNERLGLYRAELGYVPANSAAEAIAQLSAGASVLLNQAQQDHPRLAQLCGLLSAETGEPTRVNVYASSPSAPGFPFHADTHDVFVLHLAGSKEWTVAAPSVPHPLYHPSLHPLPAPADDAPRQTFTLTSGDTLYLPRGHWHQAAAVDGPSLHLTVAVFWTTGVDLLYHLVDELHAHAPVRQSLPAEHGPARRPLDAPSATAEDHLRRLRAIVDAALADPALLTRLRTARLAQQAVPRPFTLAAQLAPDALPQALAPVAQAVRYARSETELTVYLPGRALSLSHNAETLLLRALREEHVSTADVLAARGALAEDEARRLVHQLLCQGVLRPA